MSRYYLKLDLSSGQGVLWPDKCAFCGAKANTKAETSLSKVTGGRYYVVAFGWTTQTKSIIYPVCLRHKRFFTFLSEPTKWTFLDTLLFLFAIPLGIAFGLAGVFILLEEFEVVNLGIFSFYLPLSVCFLLFIFIIIWKILSGVYKPIRVADATEHSIGLSMSNKVFAQEFKRLNKDIIN